jgi:hypothetical protein
MRTRAKLVLATIGLGAAVAGIAGPAFAASTDHTTATASATTAAPSSTSAGAGAADHRAMGHRFGREFAKDLAAQLGLPQQTVTTAVQQALPQVRADHKDGTATKGEFVNQLAAHLGLDPTKVRTAVQAVRAQEGLTGSRS